MRSFDEIKHRACRQQKGRARPKERSNSKRRSFKEAHMSDPDFVIWPNRAREDTCQTRKSQQQQVGTENGDEKAHQQEQFQ